LQEATNEDPKGFQRPPSREEEPPEIADAKVWATYRFCNGRDDFRCALEVLMTIFITILATQTYHWSMVVGSHADKMSTNYENITTY